MLSLRPLAGLALLVASTAVAAVLPPGAFTLRTAPPTEMHAWMLAVIGDWEGSMRISRPGMPVMEFPIAETFHPVGERWITSDLTGDLMGHPYHGHGVFGYDAQGEALVGTYCDSMLAHLAVMGGGYDEEDKVVRMKWEAPVAGRKGLETHRSEQRVRGDTLERLYFEGGGTSEILVMTISTRRKVD